MFAALKGCAETLAILGAHRTDDIERYRYENAEVALNTGMILREMLRHEPLARILLYSERCVLTFNRE